VAILQLSTEEVLELHSGKVPDSVKSKLEPLVGSSLDGLFGDRQRDSYLDSVGRNGFHTWTFDVRDRVV
jgi:hypothetical protein